MTLPTALLWLAMAQARVSFYSNKFTGRKTASGERYDPKKHTAASRFLPLGSCVLFTNPRNGAFDYVRINDRGPWVRGRAFDISMAAARKLKVNGTALLNYMVVERGMCR